MSPEEFTEKIEAARRRNPACKACKRDLSDAKLTDVIYLKGSKRLMCVDCPEAITVEFKNKKTTRRVRFA